MTDHYEMQRLAVDKLTLIMSRPMPGDEHDIGGCHRLSVRFLRERL